MLGLSRKSLFAAVALGLFAVHGQGQAAELTQAQKDKLAPKVEEMKQWAADPAVVKAVKDQNASPSAEVQGMDQAKWDGLSMLDPVIKTFTKNPAADLLKSKKSDVVAEAFLSAADGKKVAFLAKTSGWSHKGKSKHDQPMAGKTWFGPIEVDASTGVQQAQVAVPVMDGGKAIGSLVVGFNVSKL